MRLLGYCLQGSERDSTSKAGLMYDNKIEIAAGNDLDSVRLERVHRAGASAQLESEDCDAHPLEVSWNADPPPSVLTMLACVLQTVKPPCSATDRISTGLSCSRTEKMSNV